MLYIDVGNTVRGGLRTGIQRVVRSFAYELALSAPDATRLIVFDPGGMRFFALADATRIRAADGLDEIGAAERRYFDFDDFTAGDIFLEADATWNEPLSRGSLFRLIKQKGVIVVWLNHDVIPILLPQYCHPDTLVAFAESLADHIQYADYALTNSAATERDLQQTVRRVLQRSITAKVIRFGADLVPGESRYDAKQAFDARFPELKGARFLLSLGSGPRKNHRMLIEAFARVHAPDAALVLVGGKQEVSTDLAGAPAIGAELGKRLFCYDGLDDESLLALYRQAYAYVMPSHYEGFGLPAVEALSLGCATLCSDAGALPEATQGHAAIFKSGDVDGLHGLLDRLYADAGYYASLKQKAKEFRPTSWAEAGRALAATLNEIATGAAHDFAAPLRQMVLLAVDPAKLDLALQSARNHLGFIDRVVVLTKPASKAGSEAVASRHFPGSVVLSDDEIGAGPLPADHQARNTWLRKHLYRHVVIEANFLAADEDHLTMRPIERSYFQSGEVHSAYSFLEDMGTWLAGSPTMTSFDRGMRNDWRTLREAAYPSRAFASHMPQIVNKSLVNQIFDRFVVDAAGPAYDEWSLYFNVAGHLFPRHFAVKPYGTLGWPMRMGDWLPQIIPDAPAFENYYPQNYAAADDGMFAGLTPLGDYDEKLRRYMDALARAKQVEVEGSAGKRPGSLALIVSPDALKFVATGIVLAGRRNVRRILVVNGAEHGEELKGSLEMFLARESGAVLRGEKVTLGEVAWIPLVPPEQPGDYTLRFFAALENGKRLETHARLDLIEDDSGG